MSRLFQSWVSLSRRICLRIKCKTINVTKLNGCNVNSRLLLSLIALTVVVGCSPIPVKRDVGQVNFNYSGSNKGEQTDKVIGIVASEVSQAQSSVSSSPQSTNPFIQMAMAQAQAKGNHGFNANSAYNQSYRSQLMTALNNTFVSNLSDKGFNMKGPYQTFDDITFSDKKNMYLSVVPRLTFNINQKSTGVACKSTHCTDSGNIYINGEMLLKVIEPLTGQAMLNKRINLSDFGISEPYTKQWEIKNRGGLVGMATNSVTKPEQLLDNTDKSLTRALNSFYAKAAAKIDTYLSRDELLSIQKDVAQLKELKRY